MLTEPNIPALELKNFYFRWPAPATFSLKIPDFALQKRQHLFIKGASGSGKTTLLNLLCGIHALTEGQILINGLPFQPMPASKRDGMRAAHIGVVFQQLNLIGFLSVLENVLLAAEFSPKKAGNIQARAQQLLTALDMPVSFWQQKASELSVGQAQRVAIARALLNEPAVLIADEPTSALDAENRDAFMRLMLNEADRCGTTVIFVSHDAQLACYFQWQLDMHALHQGLQPQTSLFRQEL